MALLLGSCGSSDSESYAERCDPASGKGAAGSAADTLPPQRSDDAIRLLRNDPDVQELIDGRDFVPGRAIPWTSGSGPAGKGFVVPMNFPRPLSTSSESWPVVIYPGAGRSDTDTTPRLLCRIRRTAKGVATIRATVNLTSGMVEDLSPLGPTVDDEDIGPLPEEYQPVPGY